MCFLVFFCFDFQLIAGYRYPEVDQFLGNDTLQSTKRKNKKHYKAHKKLKILNFHNFRVLLPGNSYEKNLILWISLRKQKYFWKYFRILLQELGTFDSCKKPEFKNLSQIIKIYTFSIIDPKNSFENLVTQYL